VSSEYTDKLNTQSAHSLGLLRIPELAPQVLVVDDSERIRILLKGVLETDGYQVKTAGNGDEALSMIAESPPDCILCDVMMPPGINGYEICRRLKNNEHTRLLPIIMITGLNDFEHKIQAIEAGANDFLTKPFNNVEILARVRSLIRFKRLNDELENASNVVFALARAIEAKDHYTEGHGERVSILAASLAEYIELDARSIDAVRKGGVLHDCGKIGCPDAILNKPGPLTPDEFKIILQHPEHGWEICRHLKSLQHVLPCIRWHHEKLDGTGYPDGLVGKDIPTTVRIMSITDVYDALSTARSYKPAFPSETCFRILLEEANRSWWDKDLVKAFVEMMREKGYDKPGAVFPYIKMNQLLGQDPPSEGD
jgi:putative two-component system response regulator